MTICPSPLPMSRKQSSLVSPTVRKMKSTAPSQIEPYLTKDDVVSFRRGSFHRRLYKNGGVHRGAP